MLLIYIGLFISLIEAQETTLTSSNLPIIVLETYGETIPNEPKISAHMGIIYNGTEEINYLTDPFNHYNGDIGIEIRGHSSQNFPKKNYGIETRDSEGANLNISLFGMPEENDWVLYAPYSDKSLMRNVLAYDIARSLGSYAPRTQFCEVIVNNDYVGIYVFMEKIKKDGDRVAIDDPEPENLSGGYLLELETYSKLDNTDNFFESATKGRPYVIHFPKDDDITGDQNSWIENYINEFESMLYSDSFNDPDIGYYQYIDSPSWVDYILLNEAFRNNDAFYSSTYLYKKKNGKLFAGPLWDFNIAMGNVDYNDNWLTEGWWLTSPYLSSILLEDSSFVLAYQIRWNTLRTNQLDSTTINTLIDDYAVLLETAQERNFERWPILGSDVWPNYYIGQTYEEEVNYLKQWLTDRFNWMDSQFVLESTDDCVDTFDECGVCNGDGSSCSTPSCSIADVYINEAHGDGNPEDWVEIYNSGSVDCSIAGFTLDDQNVPEDLTFDNVVISTYGYWLGYEDGEGSFGSGISKSGDTLWLCDGAGVCQVFVVGDTEEKTAWGYPNNDRAQTDGNLEESTPGAVNTGYLLSLYNGLIHEDFSIHSIYPNPFNPVTNIIYSLPEYTNVQIVVFDVSGKQVESLLSEFQVPGNYSLGWNAEIYPSGVYFLKMIAGKYINTKKVVLIK